MILLGALAFLLAIAASSAVTPGVIRLAVRLGALDLPGGRKIHPDPVARIGGVPVFVGFVVGLGVSGAVAVFAFGMPLVGVNWIGLGIASTFVFLIGLIDDINHLDFRWKFFAQILGATMTWFWGFRIELVTDWFHLAGEPVSLGWWSLPITVFWVVLVTNAVNLIDGLDGLATGIALIAVVSLTVIAALRGRFGVAAAGVALAGSLIGFLRFNFNPAKIFLGDGGAMFLGFVLAVTSVRGSQKGPTAVAILVPLLLLGVPLLDTSVAVSRRFLRLLVSDSDERRGSSRLGHALRNVTFLFRPDRGHLHHRLIDHGLSHRVAVVSLYSVAGLLSAGAIALVVVRNWTVGWILGGTLLTATVTFALAVYLVGGKSDRAAGEIDPAESDEGGAERLRRSGSSEASDPAGT